MKQVNEIEVKEAKVCNGSCESCNCATTEKKELIFEAMFHANADSPHAVEDKTFGVLVQKGNSGGWSHLVWFPKSVCKFWQPEGLTGTLCHVKAPKWILEDRKIMDIITLVE